MTDEVYPVGTRVCLSEAGRQEFCDSDHNPHGAVGVVIRNDRDRTAYVYRVDWDNETSNVYRHGDLTGEGFKHNGKLLGFGKFILRVEGKEEVTT